MNTAATTLAPNRPLDQRPFDRAHLAPDGEGRLGETVRYLMALALRHIVMILAVIALFVGAAVVLTMLQTPKYTATMSVQINDQSDNVLGDKISGTSQSAASWDVERFLNTQLKILESRALAERVAKRLNLANDPAFFAAAGAGEVPKTTPIAARQRLAEELLLSNMTATLPRDTRIAQVSYTANDPAVAAKIVNAYGEEFIQADLQRKYDSSSYARKFVGDQLGEARNRLESSERELNAYARSVGLLRTRTTDAESPTESNSVTTDSLSQLNAAANAAQARRVAAQSRWESEQGKPLMQSEAVLGNPTIQNLQSSRAQLSAQLQAMSSRYLDDYPPLIEIRRQIAAIDSEMAKVAQGLRQSVQTEYASAVSEESRLRSQVNQLRGASLSEQDSSVRYNTLAREADTNRSIYDGLLQRFRELNAASGISTSNLVIIDKAEVPTAPSSPSLVRNILIALILGIAAAMGLVFVRDMLDDAIRVPEDVEGKANLPLLGVIPISVDGTPDEEMADPKSPISEAYNSLRGSLMYATPQGLPRLLLVTSSQQAEGKSTSTIALAKGLARLGKRIVIVDADMRRPSLHRRLNVTNERGFSSLLTSSATIDQVVQPTDSENLFTIAAGPIPPSPTELVSSPIFAATIEDLLTRFECVMLDSPPVLGLADAPVMAALADGVVFVIEAGGSRRGTLRAALRRLGALKANVLGGVLTKFDPSQAGNRHSEYYGYEYYHYRQADGDHA